MRTLGVSFIRKGKKVYSIVQFVILKRRKIHYLVSSKALESNKKPSDTI